MEEQTSGKRRASMTWAQRLKRLFHIDREACHACGGGVGIVARIAGPMVIKKILTNLKEKATPEPAE